MSPNPAPKTQMQIVLFLNYPSQMVVQAFFFLFLFLKRWFYNRDSTTFQAARSTLLLFLRLGICLSPFPPFKPIAFCPAFWCANQLFSLWVVCPFNGEQSVLLRKPNCGAFGKGGRVPGGKQERRGSKGWREQFATRRGQAAVLGPKQKEAPFLVSGRGKKDSVLFISLFKDQTFCWRIGWGACPGINSLVKASRLRSLFTLPHLYGNLSNTWKLLSYPPLSSFLHTKCT